MESERMNKEELIKLGLTEDQVKAVLKAHTDTLDNQFIPKSRFDEVNNEKKTLAETIKERDKQIEDVKKAAGDNKELSDKLVALQEENKAKDTAHKLALDKAKIDNAIELALMTNNVINSRAALPFLKAEMLKLTDDGKVVGLDEQIKQLIAAEDTKFLFKEAKIKGGTPANGEPTDFSKMTYSEMEAFLAANPGAKLDV
jgi:hypothetical protein